MFSKFLSFSAAAVVFMAAAVSCGTKVSVVGNENDITSAVLPPSNVTEESTTVSTASETTAEPTTEQFSMDISLSGGEAPQSYIIADFQTVMQEPELPTGCEVVALNQTLRYLGFDIDKVKLADDFMPIDYDGTVNMEHAYVGDPKAKNGFGCLAPVIVQTADKYFASIDSPCYAVDISGSECEDIYKHVALGRPVVIWMTMNLAESYPRYRWTTQDGGEMWFADYQHCATIYGYDKTKNEVYIADPLKGNTTYSMSRFEHIYEIMQKNAVIICGDVKTQGHHVTSEAEKAVVMTTATEKKKALSDTGLNGEVNGN